MSMDITSNLLHFGGELNVNTQFEHSVKDMSTTATWTALQCGDYLITRGLNLFIHIWAGRMLYESIRVSHNIFKVIERKGCHEHTRCRKLYPVFRRVRVVKVVNNTLYCTCGYFERIGIMCSHIANVLSSLKGYTEPSHHDFSICWWKLYPFHVTKPVSECTDAEKVLYDKVEHLMSNDIKGPYCSEKQLSLVPIHMSVPEEFNKNENHIDIINFDNIDINEDRCVTFGMGVSLSQNVSQPHINFNDLDQDEDSVRHKERNVFQDLKPYFSELTDALQDDFVEDHIQKLKTVLQFHTQIASSRGVQRIQG
jgi:hypothetical protein